MHTKGLIGDQDELIKQVESAFLIQHNHFMHTCFKTISLNSKPRYTAVMKDPLKLQKCALQCSNILFIVFSSHLYDIKISIQQ